MKIDTIRHVETPEGVELSLRVAGVLSRGMACLIDVAVRAGIYSILAQFLLLAGEAGVGILLVVLFLSEWAYPVLFEVFYDGQTLGKRAIKIRVIRDDGRPVDFGSSTLRNLIRAVDFFPVAYALGIAVMLFRKDAKRLGDMAAGTLVVYVESEKKSFEAPEVDPVRTLLPLSLEEQRAILEYSERHRDWTRQRAEEVSDLVEPLTQAKGGEGVKSVLGIARWLGEER